MTRAYIRLDPAFDERKETYPDGPYAALVAVLCLAEHQPQRGRFRNVDYLRRLMGRRGRHVPYLLTHDDLTVLPDGRVYVDGWDEWQEGDWKVSERVGRIRSRQRHTVPVTLPVTPYVTSDVTVPVTAPRQNVAERSGSGSGAMSKSADGALAEDDEPEFEVLLWLNRHGCNIRPGDGYHQRLIPAVERLGANALIGMMDRLSRAGTPDGDIGGLLWKAIDALDAQNRPKLADLEAEERAEERGRSFDERVKATRGKTGELAALLAEQYAAEAKT